MRRMIRQTLQRLAIATLGAAFLMTGAEAAQTTPSQPPQQQGTGATSAQTAPKTARKKKGGKKKGKRSKKGAKRQGGSGTRPQ